MFNSPLEIFDIGIFIPFNWGVFDFSMTNVTLFTVFVLSYFYFFLYCLCGFESRIIPTRTQLICEKIVVGMGILLKTSLGPIEQKYYGHFCGLFTFVLLSNITGLIPYSFALTSQLISVMVIVLGIFVGIAYVCWQLHGFDVYKTFYPAQVSFYLSIVLIFLEVVSYLFSPLALGLRLFANITAGHVLFQLLITVGWSFFINTIILDLFVSMLSVGTMSSLYGLELAVTLIQSYVFVSLVAILVFNARHLHGK